MLSASQLLFIIIIIIMKNLLDFQAKYVIINEAQKLNHVLKFNQNTSIIGLDCETTGLDPYQSKIRLIQLAIPKQPVIVIDLFSLTNNDLEPLRNLLTSGCLKVGHNLKFEWLMLHQFGLTPNPPFFDTYLAYKVLITGLKQKLSLEAITKKLLGIKLDKTEQKSDFSGILTPKQYQYAANDAAIVLLLHQQLKQRLKQAQLTRTSKIEFTCLPAVAQMEAVGMYLDLEQWQEMSQHLKQQQAKLVSELNQQLKPPKTAQISLFPELTETINLRSPKQVKEALIAQNIPIKSTNAQELIPLAKEYPIIQTFLNYRSLASRISTFAEGIPNHIHPVTQRIHANWFQIGARSGRFSCREPNLQNIPRDRETRQCFTAPPGKILIKADYSQIELRIMAKVSGDSRMLAAYSQGKDLHQLTAALVLEKELTQVTEEERRLGKIINFGLIYGMGVRRFRHTAAKEYGVEMSLEEAYRFRGKFFESYRGIKAYHSRIRREWSRGVRESRTLGGRRRLWGRDSKPTLNELINHPIQGTNSDMTKLALGFAWRGFQGTDVLIIAAIHDEIVLECPMVRADWAMERLRDAMVKAGDFLIAPIPVEVEVRKVMSWGG
jgi:DNA polymerase I